MFALPTISPVRVRKPAIMDNAACRKLATDACAARTIQEASAIIRAHAVALPVGDWAKYLTKLADGLLSRKGTACSVISINGNSKLPFASFSALPFITCPGMGDCET